MSPTDPDPHGGYTSPLATRYAGAEMRALFSPRRRILAWRQLWLELARAERDLGIDISDAQLAALERTKDDIDFDRAAALERELRHDVMAHIRAWGEAAPEAAGILHLGATSCFVTDNGDQLIYREGLRHVARGLAAALAALRQFAQTHRALPCLGYTHYQVAQLTTFGKRATLWAQDLLDDLLEVERLADTMRLRGIKGATGTQASFLGLFEGDHARVVALDAAIAQALGFAKTYPVSGQTYPRKLDSRILNALGGVAESAAKMACDIRLLSGSGELAEPIRSSQVGSSAMPYKRNPMRCERICSLARFVHSLATSPPQTAATQWLERTLDDSANRRLTLPEAFLAADAILRLVGNVARGLTVNAPVIGRRVREMMPFLATEDLMLAAAAAGGDRQALHEAIRTHAFAAWSRVEAGEPNDLLARLAADPAFAAVADQLDPSNTDTIIRPERYVGRAPEQVDAFLAEELAPKLADYPDAEQWETGLSV